MRAKTILTILFLLSLTVAAGIFLRAMGLKMPAQASAGPEVLVAAAQLPPGTLLRAQDVTWHAVGRPTDSQMILRPDEKQRAENPKIDEQTLASVFGAAVRMTVADGAPITKDVIVKPGDRDFLRIVLTPGERAISIPVKTGGASTGLLDPGDHVDVILTQKFEDKAEPMARRSVSEIVAEALRVLAIDARPANPQEAMMAQQAGDFGRTVTLEVTPAQAQKINVATELGKLSLTLRPSGTQVVAGHQNEATWAGDVSPALGSVNPPTPVTADPPTIAIFRGDKPPVSVKLR